MRIFVLVAACFVSCQCDTVRENLIIKGYLDDNLVEQTGTGKESDRSAVESSELRLDVLHINDIHSYFEETSSESVRCRNSTEFCYGGIARIYTKQKEIRDMNPDTTIFLNAGDFYQGTLWYTKYKYEPMIKFGNWLNYTAMGIGNHDFDDGVDGLIPFAEGADFALLASNLFLNNTNFTEGEHFSKSTVIVVNGTRVGIIGYITRTTNYNFPHQSITFLDEIESISAEAQRLHDDGVKILIALGHSGYKIEKQIAELVPHLDAVVGGHSHTFLFTPLDDQDIPEDDPEGPYPTYITSSTGRVVPVVQARCYTKYLGHLTLNFDAEGELKLPVEGAGVSFARPYLMNNEVVPDPTTLAMMKPYQANLTEYKEVLGNTTADMVGRGTPDSVETNLGNELSKSMAAVYNDTFIGVVNNGGIRNNIKAGEINGEDIFYVLPFGNTVDKLVLKGAQLRTALERAASNLDPNNPEADPGFGLQFVGLRLEIEVRASNVGKRIVSLQVEIPSSAHAKAIDDAVQYEDIDDEEVYAIAINSFMAPEGAQRYERDIFDDLEYIEHVPGVITDFDAMKKWVIENSPLKPSVEGKLRISYPDNSAAVLSSVGSGSLLMAVAVALTLCN